MVVQIPLRLTTHNQKIASVYKKWLRYLEGNCLDRIEYRYKAVLARAEFDCILCQKDKRISKKMLQEKEDLILSTFHLDPAYFPQSPKGVDYGRHLIWEDWVLDFWHPLEKAIYPKYFAKRELRKQQYLEMWEKQHQPPPPCDH